MASKDNAASHAVDARVARIEGIGVAILRYGIVFLLVLIGAAKYWAFEAEAIQPLVAHSPFLSWMLDVFGLQTTSNLIGTAEIATGLAIASRPVAPTVSAIGSAIGVVIFLTTLSFLFSTPGALSLKHPAGGFLLKDIVLLGACVATCAEALRAAQARRARRADIGYHGTPASRVA